VAFLGQRLSALDKRTEGSRSPRRLEEFNGTPRPAARVRVQTVEFGPKLSGAETQPDGHRMDGLPLFGLVAVSCDVGILCPRRSERLVHFGVRGRMRDCLNLRLPARCVAVRARRSNLGQRSNTEMVQAPALRAWFWSRKPPDCEIAGPSSSPGT
jgi:hypothetical protein